MDKNTQKSINKIIGVKGREILDSRGNPTVEAELYMEQGESVLGVAPSGASTGIHEAHELRDNDPARYHGKGVLKAVSNISDILAKEITGHKLQDEKDLQEIDMIMRKRDGSENKEVLGANAILAVSFAALKGAAQSEKLPIYRFLGGERKYKIPMHMDNCLNGGVHVISNNLDFQEFMILPVSANSVKEGVRMCSEVYHTLKKLLETDGKITSVGDEGGFAPDIATADEVFSYFMEAVKKSGYEPGTDIAFAMDAAASELYQEDAGMYYFPGESKARLKKEYEPAMPDTKRLEILRNTDEMVALYQNLVEKYPLISIEDGLDEEDWEGWTKLTEALGDKVMLVGDDLFVTNAVRLRRGIEKKAANAILIKPNQIGTVSETRETIELAKKYGYKTIMSHRSGETEDSIIADLAVGFDTDYIKTGAPCRGERTAKYNRLIRIEEEI